MEIVPAILSADEHEVKEKLDLLRGVASSVQLDIIDGKFADNVTVGPEVVKEFVDDFVIEAHLMVVEPFTWIERCAESGIQRVLCHVEHLRKLDQELFVNKVLETGMEVGLCLDIDTDVFAIGKNLWVWLDRVLVMGVKAGWSAQEFNRVALTKINQLKELRDAGGYAFLIEEDGGAHEETIGDIVKAGVDVIGVTSAVWKGGKVEENLKRLKEVVGISSVV